MMARLVPKDWLERHQLAIYYAAVALGAAWALALPRAAPPQAWVSPALAVMMFATFLQVPLGALRQTAGQGRFLACLLFANFVLVPVLAFALASLAPDDDRLRFGVLLVLLTPCVDYVVTFTHLGRGDARALLAATPVLLLVQLLMLPVYLGLFLGEPAQDLIRSGPFVDALVWMIVVPLALAGAVQAGERRSPAVAAARRRLDLLPVPATAVVLALVAASVVPQIEGAAAAAAAVAPLYVAFAVVAPVLGWLAARAFGLAAAPARAVCFSTATRNSLVVLPIALAVPGAMPLLPAVVVTQTLVELLAELVYVRVASSAPKRAT